MFLYCIIKSVEMLTTYLFWHATKNETVCSSFYVMCCLSIYYIFLNLSKDAENPANLTSFVVACSIGNITIWDLQDYVKVTIKHTKIQVKQHWLFRGTEMQIIYSKG